MFFSVVLLMVGLVLLIKGADLFVGGASKIAKSLKIPSLIIGLTLVSLGTSAPEASISINAGLNNLNEMSISNVVGSNIFNTLFILGTCAIIAPLIVDDNIKKYDIPIMIVVYLLLLMFSFIITPYKLDFIESIILIIILILYMLFLALRVKNQNGENIEEDNLKIKKIEIIKGAVFSAVGLAMIIFGGDVVVENASNIAIYLGMSESLTGLTIVAMGTGFPELITSVVASVKKENDIAVGNVIGSNILNIIFVLGCSSALYSLTVTVAVMFDIIVMFLAGIIIFLITLTSKNINRWQGVLLLLIYVAYLTYIIIRN